MVRTRGAGAHNRGWGRGVPTRRRSGRVQPEVVTQNIPPLPVWGGKRRRLMGYTTAESHRVDEEERIEVSDNTAGMKEIADNLRLLTQVVLGQQTAAAAPVPPHAEDKEVPLFEFVRLKPPKFSGLDGEDPVLFLEEIDTRCKPLRCSSLRAAQFAEFCLSGAAKQWFVTEGSPTWIWEEFSKALLDRFLPKSVRLMRAREFENLRQDPCMTVTEYLQRVGELSKYAPHMVATEEDKIDRFIEGLVTHICNMLVAMRFATLGEAADAARRIEFQSPFRREERGPLPKKGKSEMH